MEDSKKTAVKQQKGLNNIISKQNDVSIDSIPKLKSIMHSYFEHIADYVRRNIGKNIDVSLRGVAIVKWSEIIEDGYLKNCGLGVACNISQLRSPCAMIFHQGLVYCLIENMLGGDPQRHPLIIKDRRFSKVEVALIEQVSLIFAQGLSEAMKDVLPLRVEINKIETNPEYVMHLTNEENVIHMAIKLQQSDSIGGMFDFIMPFNSINYIRDLLSHNDKKNSDTDNSSDNKWHKSMEKMINRINVVIRAEMNNTSLSLHNVSQLAIGDTVIMDRTADEDAEIKINGRLIGYGKLGKVKDSLAIQVTDVFKYGDNDD